MTETTPEAREALRGIADRIAEVMAEGDGHWLPCTGCQESVDGCVSSTDYPFDPVFQCQPGGGCGECGGIGVTWTPSDFYDGLVEWSHEQDRTHANVLAALGKLVVSNGEIIGKQSVADAILALSPPAISKAVEAEREVIARIVDPHGFRSWQSMYDYGIKQGDSDEEAKGTADWAHKKECDDALAKADLILDFIRTRTSISEVG